MKLSLPVILLVFSLPLVAAEEGVGSPQALEDGERIAKAMRLPAGYTAHLFAQHPLFGNPVAIDVDTRGRVLVAEQYRFNQGTEENRTSGFLLDDDLQLQTVDDRLAMFKKWAGRYRGGMDWFTRFSDKIRVVSDEDGDGRADHSSVLAEFAEPLDGLSAGVLAVGDDVWATCIPNLWRLRDHHGTGVADERTRIHTGFGVRASFLGHDLHALTMGMDGRLYFSLGDRGYHVVTKEDATLHGPDNGGVFRCDLDGANLEIIHRGMRNPQGIAFNEYGDLFAGDNNCDKGDKSRLIYVVDGGDSGWRMNYQSMPRPVSGGSWMAEELWRIESPLNPQWAVPAVGYIGSGPSGLRFSAVGAWPEPLRNRFFHMNFVGNSGIITFATVADGAGFRIEEYRDFLTPMNITDCGFGYDGRLYVANYPANPWKQDIGGRLFTVSAAATPQTEIDQLRALAIADFRSFSDERLAGLLDHPDQRIRLRAQFTLAADPTKHLPLLTATATNPSGPTMARLHATWGLWMIARRDPRALAPLRDLAKAMDPVIRTQAYKVLSDVRDRDFAAGFTAGLDDASPRVQFFAAEGLGRIQATSATAPLIALLRRNAGKDRFIQHAAVTALGRIGDRAAVMACAGDAAPAIRLAVVLALRQWGDARLAAFLADPDDRIALEAARAIYECRVTAAYPALAAAGARAAQAQSLPLFKDALARRVLTASRRLADQGGVRNLLQVIADPGASAATRATAYDLLGKWDKPIDRDLVTGEWWPMPAGDAAIARAAVAAASNALFAEPMKATWKDSFALLAALAVEIPAALPERVANDAQADLATRGAAFAYLEKSAPTAATATARAFLKQPAPELQSLGVKYLRSAEPGAAVALCSELLADQGSPLGVKQTCVDALASLATPESVAVLNRLLERIGSGEVPAGLQLDLLLAARRCRAASGDLDRRLSAYDAALAGNKDPLAPYQITLAGGNAANGEKLFTNHPIAQCTRCHMVAGKGGVAGPDLSHIAGTLTKQQLLEALIVPSARLAPGYALISLTTVRGEKLTGVVAAETADGMDLDIAKDKRIHLALRDIAERGPQISPMPPMGVLLKIEEIRDVLAYLQTLTK